VKEPAKKGSKEGGEPLVSRGTGKQKNRGGGGGAGLRGVGELTGCGAKGAVACANEVKDALAD